MPTVANMDAFNLSFSRILMDVHHNSISISISISINNNSYDATAVGQSVGSDPGPVLSSRLLR